MSRKTLDKTLKPHWVWAIALGSSIGWGAFVLPVEWMGKAGPLGVIIGFAIGAVLMGLIAVSYGFLIEKFPVSGGEFAYSFISMGKTHAFICGWFLTLGYICIVALNASAFALMFKFVFPDFTMNFKLYTIAGWDVYLIEILVATIALAFFTYLNIKGSGLSGKMQFIFCLIMLGGVFILTTLVGGTPQGSFENVQPLFKPEISTLAAILSIVAIAPWAYVGFDNIPQAAEEFNFSSKKAFSLIILAILFALVLYSMMIIATAMANPWEQMVDAGYIWGTGAAISDLLGTTGLFLLVLALSMGIFTGLNGFTISSSRLLFAMSRAKILPPAFSKLHPKSGTPYVGIIFTAIIASLAPWFGREVLLWVVDMSSIGVSIAYFYTSYTAYTFYKWSTGTKVENANITTNPTKKFIALLGMIASIVFMLLLLLPFSPAYLGIESRIALIIWIALGGIFYLANRQVFNNLSNEELSYLILGENTAKK
ncbi:APC family permease [Thalassobacillus devorans]|uniref:APC family permease n=1 Tax=Thalassobacillus devorans TaxID=279813 RepID=UPI000A1CB69D|nr:APC family permease [Thalassobacillus devorans]